MVSAFESSLVFDLSQRWPDIEYLAAVLAPSADEIEMSVAERLGGLTAEEFVAARRAAAAATMLEAQARRVKGSIPEAIQSAYESDFLALEAYLVESAVAAGDTQILTVTCRWELTDGGDVRARQPPVGVPAGGACHSGGARRGARRVATANACSRTSVRSSGFARQRRDLGRLHLVEQPLHIGHEVWQVSTAGRTSSPRR